MTHVALTAGLLPLGSRAGWGLLCEAWPEWGGQIAPCAAVSQAYTHFMDLGVSVVGLCRDTALLAPPEDDGLLDDC
jgi:hypothetical protein